MRPANDNTGARNAFNPTGHSSRGPQLRRDPAFTTVGVITLALGIGASTAVFSVIDAVLLEPPPYQAPERLVNLWMTDPEEGDPFSTVSYANYQAWGERTDAFASLGAYTITSFNIAGGRQPERAHALAVTASLLSTLGIEPQLGRNFQAEADRPGGARTILISHGLWQRTFGGDPDVIGRTVRLDGVAHEVVGVLPERLRFPPPLRLGETALSRTADVWVPIGTLVEVFEHPGVARFFVVGRRAAGVSLAEARAEMAILAAGIADADGLAAAAAAGKAGTGPGIRVVSLTEQVLAPARPALFALLGAVGLVLLITCVNVAGLLLARLARRNREIALRAALGADRRRIVRELLSESVILAMLGGGLGSLLAWIGMDALLALAPADIPRLEHATIDAGVLTFALILSLATGLVFGLLPAVRASRSDLKSALVEGGASAGTARSTRRVQGALVATQIALAVALLASAGLLIRSFAELTNVDPGFDTRNLLTFDLLLPGTRYPDDPARVRFYVQLQARLAVLPGVRSVSAIDRMPFGIKNSWIPVSVPGGPTGRQRPDAINSVVLPRYFDAMGIPLLRGRAFDAGDDAAGPPVVIISRSLAERFWPNSNPVGQQVLAFGPRSVVGVAGDVRQYGPSQGFEHVVYFPQGQSGRSWMTLVLRTSVEPGSLIAAVRREVGGLDAQLPLANLQTFAALESTHTAGERFNALLTGMFATLALALAALGIYGVMSFAVAGRTREIGVRIALGASGGAVRSAILREAMMLVAVGTAAGLFAGLALARLVRGLLFGISPTDPLTYAAAGGLLALAGLLAAWVPARRATMVDPMTSLRQE